MFWGSQVFPLWATLLGILTQGPQSSHPVLTLFLQYCSWSCHGVPCAPRRLAAPLDHVFHYFIFWARWRLVQVVVYSAESLSCIGDQQWRLVSLFQVEILQPLLINFSPLARSLWKKSRSRRQSRQIATPSPNAILTLSSTRKIFPIDVHLEGLLPQPSRWAQINQDAGRNAVQAPEVSAYSLGAPENR